MSKLIYLISILILSFLMPTTGYSSAVPTSSGIKTSIVKKKRTKKKRYKRVKRPNKTQQIHNMAVFLLSIPVLFLLGGLILLIVGLIIQIPLVWIIGLILLGVLVLGLIIFFISLSTSLSNSNME